MVISYDKLQRKTILRSVEDKSMKQKDQETPSKDSTLSLPKSSEVRANTYLMFSKFVVFF